MNIKKIGLTALAGSLVATSAYAGAMSVSGGASMALKNDSGTQAGKSWTMGNSLTFTGGGELDNGINVSLSFELDGAEGVGQANAPFDSHSLTLSSDGLGTLVFAGHGGSSAQGAIDTTAAGDLWNNGSGITGPTAAASGDNSMLYTLPAMVDGVGITASYSPGRASQDSHTAFAISYTGVEGLTLNYGQGDSGAPGSEITSTTMKASYAVGSFTLGASKTEADKTGASDREVTSYNVAYTVSDDISVGYGVETFDTAGQSVDEEVRGFNISYTTGGMTLGAMQVEGEGIGNSASSEKDRWKLSASFAF
jgi:outer membrane protein OmpU